MNKAVLVSAAIVLALPAFAWAGGPPQTPQNPFSAPANPAEDVKRQATLAEFAAKMKAANYPALFEQAAQEFNVPADVLKGVSFAETRWDHLTWPPGETASPETGMPRPYGIMSLWDNPFFGHSLLEAAALVARTPEQLKQDPLQNMRGAAALLRKLYDETPKPDGTTEADIESWRYAIRKYCGIPEPELNAQHALDIYVFMSQGYHEYGMEWAARRVNLEPIREETRRIVAEAQARREALRAPNSNAVNAASAQMGPSTLTDTQVQARRMTNRPSFLPVVARMPANTLPAAPSEPASWWYIGLAVVLLLAVFTFSRNPSNPPE
jgi:hypothetical protein